MMSSQGIDQKGRNRTFEFEREVVGQVTTLVVAAEEKKSLGVPDFQGP